MLKIILKVIGKKQSLKARKLFILMLISMILETIGVGLVLPFIDIVDKGASSIIMEFDYISTWTANFSHEKLIITSLIFLVVFFILKNGFLASMSWYRVNFLAAIQNDISRKLFKGYLNMPYSFHLQTNTAYLIRSIRDESAHLIGGLDHFIEILTQSLVLLGIVFFLIWVEPIGGVVVFLVLGLAGFIFHKVTKSRLTIWGKDNLYREGLRLKHLQQGLNGIKDVKIFRKEGEFLDNFYINNTLFLSTNKKHKFLSSLPKLWFEFLAIFGIALLTFSILFQEKTIESLVAVLAVYAAAAFRLMPNLNNILVGLQGVQFAKENINNVYKSFVKIEKESFIGCDDALDFNKVIEFKNVSYKYDKTKNLVLRDINLKIYKGEMIGIIGPSGAGKSTFIDMLTGLLEVSEGGIFVDGININTSINGWMKIIGYVPQHIYLIDGTIQDNIAFGVPKSNVNKDSIDKVLNLANLRGFMNDLPDGVNTIVGENGSKLSGGQRQRIGIARALYHNPELIVFDEATSALDVDTEESIMKAVAKINTTKTIIFITHKLSILNGCSQIYRVKNRTLINSNIHKDEV